MADSHQTNDGLEQPLLTADEAEESPPQVDSRAAGYGTTTAPASSRKAHEEQRGTFTRNLGAVEAFGILVSIVIGSGVFTSPGAIDTNVPSPGAALLVWLLGGVLAWTGASTVAELSTAIPGEGGVQPYLQYILGEVAGFLAAWTWVVAVMPATLAILSIVFVESAFSAAGVTDQAAGLPHKLLSVLVLLVMSVANSISTKASTRLNGFFVLTKFVTILAVVVAGLAVVLLRIRDPDRDVGGRDWFEKSWFAYRKTTNPDGSETDWAKLGQWDTLGHYSAALYGALWAYFGWDKAIYVSAELRSPARQLPLAINSAIPTIVVSFLAANAAYYILLPWKVISTTDSVAVTAITRLLGQGFGIVAAILICLVVAGSLLGNSFVAGRMAVAAANKDWFPRLFAAVGRIGPHAAGVSAFWRRDGARVGAHEADDDDDDDDDDDNNAETNKSASDAPINAIILSFILATVYILVGNFRALLTFNGLGEYTFFFLTVLGAIILRFREPGLHRPYRPFIVVPVIFALVSGFVVVRGAVFAPVQAGVLLAVWASGLAFYWARRRWFARV